MSEDEQERAERILCSAFGGPPTPLYQSGDRDSNFCANHPKRRSLSLGPESPISGDFRAVGERQKINRSRQAALLVGVRIGAFD
jgi:hypothetical protein